MILSIGCGEDITQTSPPPVPELTLDDIVRLNSRAVQDAAEEFATENNGEYPHGLTDRSAAGRTLIDLLPDGALLENPYTNAVDVPVELTAVNPGESAYRLHYDGDGSPIGYRITGFGEYDRIITLSNLQESLFIRDETVIENCFIVRDALEMYANSNDGQYPHNVWVDPNLQGLNLVYYLPDGVLLPNPYYDDRPVIPIDGLCSDEPGYCGFVFQSNTDGRRTGYFIDGCGQNGVIIEMMKLAE
jgi:hypothetical protein